MPRRKPQEEALYRLKIANKPDDDMDVLDVLPIIPPDHPRITADFHREIAWTTDYRGNMDDTPCLMYVGAGYTLVKKVFLNLFGNGSAAFRGFRLYRDYFVRQRQRKAWERIVVEFKELDESLISLIDLGNIMENAIRRECWCNIKHVKLNRFLNL